MNPLVQRQQEHNQQTREGWERFAEHRRRVTELLLPVTPTGKSLCVLGAGNSNDLDLARLTAAYAEVHLVDLDAEALAAGIQHQRPSQSDRIRSHGGADLSGILQRLAENGEIQDSIEAALAAPRPLDESFDTVASVCLLSQLIHSVVLTLGAEHPRFLDVLTAVRLRHLRMMQELLKPGGTAVLVTDVVSSDTCPALVTVSEAQLPALVRQLIESRNFFHGLNPAVIAQLLRSDPQLAPRIEDLQFVPPWRWDLGPRQYAVYVVQWKARATA
jgi:hypothetical protein